MSKDRKKLIALICLVMLWITLIVVQRSRREPHPAEMASVRQGASTPKRAPGPRLPGQGKKRAETPELKLSKIEKVRPPFEPQVRNIFASANVVPPPPPPPKPQLTPTPPPPDPFLEQAKTIRFLGFAEADGKSMAFVAYGDETLVVTEQEVFGSQFRVRKVQEDTLILGSLDGTREVRIGLNQAPGASASRSAQDKQERSEEAVIFSTHEKTTEVPVEGDPEPGSEKQGGEKP